MSRGSKIFIGILSFLPFILTGTIIIMIIQLIPEFMEWERYEPDFYTVFSTFTPLLITGIILGLLCLGLLIFYIIHMMNNKNMEPVEKLVWIVVFLFFGMIGYPIYWFMRIWNEKIE